MVRIGAATYTGWTRASSPIPLPFAPADKHGGGTSIGRPRVAVADVDGKILEETQNGPVY